MLWVPKRTILMRRFFEHPKCMYFILMAKKISTILRSNISYALELYFISDKVHGNGDLKVYQVFPQQGKLPKI